MPFRIRHNEKYKEDGRYFPASLESISRLFGESDYIVQVSMHLPAAAYIKRLAGTIVTGNRQKLNKVYHIFDGGQPTQRHLGGELVYDFIPLHMKILDIARAYRAPYARVIGDTRADTVCIDIERSHLIGDGLGHGNDRALG